MVKLELFGISLTVYWKIKMTLNNWRETNRFTWLNIAIQLQQTGNGSFFVNRLNRLRTGKSDPTHAELKALLELTRDEVDSFRD